MRWLQIASLTQWTESEQSLGDSGGQRRLESCSPGAGGEGGGGGGVGRGVGRVRHDLMTEQQAPKNINEMLKLIKYRV